MILARRKWSMRKVVLVGWDRSCMMGVGSRRDSSGMLEGSCVVNCSFWMECGRPRNSETDLSSQPAVKMSDGPVDGVQFCA